jgi:hypothetical protein
MRFDFHLFRGMRQRGDINVFGSECVGEKKLEGKCDKRKLGPQTVKRMMCNVKFISGQKECVSINDFSGSRFF